MTYAEQLTEIQLQLLKAGIMRARGESPYGNISNTSKHSRFNVKELKKERARILTRIKAGEAE